ncbi:MAG: hypothetical protein KKB82_04410 [Candidatus Omnitrophica bacterium]|nr:hypothetical protein [Candidatus Omnitrophota bacterium]MBU1925148.1 hypothetical protein [Candidatus Omnitrophota bacterium]
MKLKFISKIIGLALIQAISAVNFAWAGNTIASFNQPVDYLSPAINIKAEDVKNIFLQINSVGRLKELVENKNPRLGQELSRAKIEKILNERFLSKGGKSVIHSLEKRGDEYASVRVNFKWRWDPEHETKDKLAIVLTGFVTDVDVRDHPYYNSVLRRGRNPKIMTKLIIFGKDGINVSHIEVMPAMRQRGLATFTMNQLKEIAMELNIDVVKVVHITNWKTLAILHKFAAEHGQGIEEVRRHIARYPQLYKNKMIDRTEIMKLIGEDVALTWQPEKLYVREMFITSLVGALEALERHGVDVNEQKFEEEMPFVAIFENAGYKNIQLVFDKYIAQGVDEDAGGFVEQEMKEIQIHARTKLNLSGVKTQPVDGKQQAEDTAETIVKKIYDAFESSLFRQGEYKFIPAVSGKIAEIYIFGANEDIIGSVRLMVNDERTIILSNAEIFEKKHQQKGLFTEVLRKINEVTNVNVRLRNYQIRNLETLHALRDRLLPEMAEKVQVPRILHDNLAAKLRKLGNIVDISDLDSPLTNAHRKAGYNNFLLVVERGINDLGYEGDILIIEAYKQKPLLNPKNSSSRTIEKFGVPQILSVEQAI